MSVYACSDLHGSLELWNKIKNYLHPEDVLYFLGDAADRGVDGWEIIKNMLDNPRVVYIRGNHEQMLLNTMIHGLPDEMALWRQNGGLSTWMAAKDDKNIREYLDRLNETPLFSTYCSTNYQYYLCHAGYTPPFYKDLLWDRSHFWDKIDHMESDEIIVHGHTPTDILKERFEWFNYDEDEATWSYSYTMHHGAMIYANGHKIDLDCGTAYNHCTVLMDLDTFSFIPFKEDKNNGQK